ncbi:hypothetical protein NPIL_347531 [Nephila pilipes]|uniref:Uncharacterized protein n=1 Tax=Nephila pilipes TaxID=299642 RepID=A0A8X6UIM4_NEPPI|nr:hypothetical protein NPIL_347531 [Nephila pilipes]
MEESSHLEYLFTYAHHSRFSRSDQHINIHYLLGRLPSTAPETPMYPFYGKQHSLHKVGVKLGVPLALNRIKDKE